MASIVAKATIRTDSWKNVYGLLTDGTNGLTDPKSRGLAVGKWVFSASPDVKHSDFPGYPIVIIHSPAPPRDKLDIRGTKGKYVINIPIDVYSDSNQYLKNVLDQVQNILLTYQTTTSSYKMKNLRFFEDAGDAIITNEKKLHVQTITAIYEAIL